MKVRCYKVSMRNEQRTEELRDRYRHSGFYPNRAVSVASWDAGARIIRLTRRSKKLNAVSAEWCIEDGTIDVGVESEISRVAMPESFLSLKFVV
jgi:hypothetical protein